LIGALFIAVYLFKLLINMCFTVIPVTELWLQSDPSLSRRICIVLSLLILLTAVSMGPTQKSPPPKKKTF
jgi:hypothetical protein